MWGKAARAFYLVTACAAGVEKLYVEDTHPPPSRGDTPSIARRVDMVLAELKRFLSRYWACFK